MQMVLAIGLWFGLVSQTAQPTAPLSHSFKVAAEGVVDAADDIDETASETAYAGALQRTKTAQSALSREAEGAAELAVVKATAFLILSTETCRSWIGVDSDRFVDCLHQKDVFRTSVLALLQMHKSGGMWLSGYPG